VEVRTLVPFVVVAMSVHPVGVVIVVPVPPAAVTWAMRVSLAWVPAGRLRVRLVDPVPLSLAASARNVIGLGDQVTRLTILSVASRA